MPSEALKFVASISPGGVGIWVLVVVALLGFWRELPKFLAAWDNRISKEAERNNSEFQRLSDQIKASDERHADCEEEQKSLRKEIGRLNGIINGLIKQMQQVQISAVRMGAVEEPPMIAALLAALDRPVNGDLS